MTIRLLRFQITRNFFSSVQSKRLSTQAGLHPSLVKRPELIFRDAPSSIPVGENVQLKNERVVVYTCVTNGYDNLEPALGSRAASCDYIVFTDDPNLHVDGWKTVFLENPTNLDVRRLSRKPKLLPHRFLSDYDISIYVDGNLTLMGDLSELVQFVSGNDMAAFSHPENRNSVYEEAEEILKQRLDSINIVRQQVEKYKSEGLPAKCQMFECRVLVRRHYSQRVMDVMETWWHELVNGSHRDQISLGYSLWKNSLDVKTIPGNVRDNDFFFKRNHLKSRKSE